MATLPTADDLSKPNGFRSGRDIAPGPTDYIGSALQNLGQSVQGLGEAMHARSQEQSAIDSANALAGFQTDAIKIDQKYRIENDPDYATYDKRSSADLEESRGRWAGTIADPKRKAAFLASTQPDAAQHTATITNRGVALGKDKNIQDANTALDGLVNAALASNDPAVVNKSLAGVHDLIDQLEKTGAVTPGVAAQMRRERAQQYAKLSLESDAAADPTGTLAKVGLSAHEKDPGGDLTTQSAALLKHFEGFAGKASWDVDHHRLGYGSDTITTADGKVIEVKPGMTVTPEDAERDLKRRLPYAINSASETVGGNFFKLSTRAQAALVSLEYNYKNGLRNKALAGVVSAAQSGDPEALAKAIESLPAGSSDPEIAKGLKNRRAQEAAYIRGGTTDLSVSATDPRVALLAPEDIVSIRTQAASHAASQETAARAAQARQAADVKGSYELGIRTGELTDPTRFLNDGRIDDGDKASLMATFDAAFSEQKKTAAAIGRLQSGQTFQPYDSGDRADANRIYNAAGGAAGLVEGDAKASGGLQYVVDKTGVVPPDALTALRGAIAGPNASYAANAYKVAADLYQQNPRIFDAYDGGSDLAKAAEAYTHFTRDWGLDGAAAAARIQKAYSPETQRTAEALKPQTDAFVKGLDVHDIAEKVGGGGFPVFGFGKPSEGATQGQAAAFAADVAEIGRQAFIDANGDAEAAKAATVAQVKGLYAVSNTSGHPALMRNAPELRYPPLGPGAGNRDYIRDEALKFAAQATGMPIAAPVPGAVDDTVSAADRGKPGVAGIALAATRETVRDFKTGVPNPHYDVVVWTWKDGQKVLGDVLHGFQVPTTRMDEIRQAAIDEAVRTHGVVRSNIDQADEALARRRANMYGGEPEYPDKGGAAPVATPAPAAAPAAAPAPAPAPAPQPTGPLNESGLPSNVPQRSAPGSTVVKSLAAPKSANAEKPPLVSPRLQDRPGSTHIEDRRDEQLFPHRQGVDIWTVEPGQRPDIIRGWIVSENKVIARFGDVSGNVVVEQAKLQRDYYQQLLDGLEAALAKGSKK